MAQSQRLISLREFAVADMAMIWRYNADNYGVHHADRYIQMLREKISMLASRPATGQLRRDLLNCYYLRVQKPGTRHGHNIFYQFDDSEIDIIRILHTAQNWQDIMAAKD